MQKLNIQPKYTPRGKPFQYAANERAGLDQEDYFKIRPSRIMVLAENVDRSPEYEQESTPINLCSNITARSEFLVQYNDVTHEHHISQEEQLTQDSQEIEIADSVNVYTESNGDTEYDGACHSAARTQKSNSAYQHTVSSVASSRSRVIGDQTLGESANSQENNTHEKSQIDDIILIEAPSKEFDNSESSPGREGEGTSQEESMLSSENNLTVEKLRLYTICEEPGSSVSESNDLLSMSDRPDSRIQDLSDFSKRHAVGKNGVHNYVKLAAGFKQVNIKSLAPQDLQEKSSFIVSELSNQQIHLTGDLLGSYDEAADGAHLTSFSSAQDKNKILMQENQKPISQTALYNESSTFNQADSKPSSKPSSRCQNQGLTRQDPNEQSADQQGEGNRFTPDLGQITCRNGSNTDRFQPFPTSFEAASQDLIVTANNNLAKSGYLGIVKQSSDNMIQVHGSESVKHFHGSSTSNIEATVASKKESQRYRDIDNGCFSGMSEDELSASMVELNDLSHNDQFKPQNHNPVKYLAHTIIEESCQQSKSGQRSISYVTSQEEDTSLFYPNNDAVGKQTAMRATESAMRGKEGDNLSSWLAVDSVPQIKQQPSCVVSDSMVGAGLIGQSEATNGNQMPLGIDPITQSLIYENLVVPPDSSNTKSAIPLNYEAAADIQLRVLPEQNSSSIESHVQFKEVSSFKVLPPSRDYLNLFSQDYVDDRSDQIFIKEAASSKEQDPVSRASEDSLEVQEDSHVFDERAYLQSTVRLGNKPKECTHLFRPTAYHSQPIKKNRTHVFQMKPKANQMDQLYGDSAVKKPVHTEDEQSTIEKTVKRFHNSNYSNGISTERQSVEFRDPRTKQVFLRASMLETEQNLKRLSLIISESEEQATQLRNPADLGSNQ